MPPLPQRRAGDVLRIKDRPLEFSFWPVERTTRRYGLGTRVFATDPWTVIRRSAERRCVTATRSAAFALLEQAEDFYRAASSGVKAAKPLLLYYCFMSLGKAFLIACRRHCDVNNAQHGLSEKLDPKIQKPVELINAYLNAYPSPNRGGQIQNFSELLEQFAETGVATNPFRYDLLKLLPQIVPGHRLWVEGDGRHNTERFVSVEHIDFVQNTESREIWLQFYLMADDLRRIDITRENFLARTRLGRQFRQVDTQDVVNGRRLICFEQINPTAYTHRPSDEIPKVVASVRRFLWRTVLNTPPYRKYYLYAAPASEHLQVLPQVLSIYAIMFYLGSIVRYRPHCFDAILEAHYGPFIEAFLNDQPSQFIYLMASEFAEKEVTKAAIV